MLKSILIGSVSSSREMLLAMIDVGFPISHVFSLDEQYSANVSGYYPIHEIAAQHDIPYTKFHKINDVNNYEIIKEIQPDYIFVIGLSQLIQDKIMALGKKGVIGFHPAPLPKMRGRAANVWQVLLGVKDSKCTFFYIDDGIDSGDILAQESYQIDENDYAEDVVEKIEKALANLARRILPDIMNGTAKAVKQDENQATYLLKRVPEDGRIDWEQSIYDIHRLIRATSKPYPGAFGEYDGEHKIIIWRADIMDNHKYIGIPGQIAAIEEGYFDVVCQDGLLRVTDYENVDRQKLLIGHKLK